MSSIFALYIFSHKHIKSVSLLKGGKEVAIETYTNFGLTYSRPKILPVSSLEGNRIFLTKKLNLFQLEYTLSSAWAGITKRRSFFYRPEFVSNPRLW